MSFVLCKGPWQMNTSLWAVQVKGHKSEQEGEAEEKSSEVYAGRRAVSVSSSSHSGCVSSSSSHYLILPLFPPLGVLASAWVRLLHQSTTCAVRKAHSLHTVEIKHKETSSQLDTSHSGEDTGNLLCFFSVN